MPHGVNNRNQLFEQHLERTRTHPSATSHCTITVETRNITSHSDIASHSNITPEAGGIDPSNSNIRSSSIRTCNIRTANKATVGLLGPGFSGGSLIEHMFDCTGGV